MIILPIFDTNTVLGPDVLMETISEPVESKLMEEYVVSMSKSELFNLTIDAVVEYNVSGLNSTSRSFKPVQKNSKHFHQLMNVK